MSSINSTIEEMTRRGSLYGVFGAYLYAALLVAGPWIFTVLGLLFLSVASCDGSCTELTRFRSIVIYNSMYALIVTSPLAFVAGRHASELIHCRRNEHVFHLLVVSLCFFAVLTLATAGPFYLFATTLDPPQKVASIENVLMIGGSWLLIPFLGAMRSYNTILLAFGSAAATLLVAGMILPDHSTGSLLFAFNGAIAIANVLMLGAVVRRFGTAIVADPELKKSLTRKWELPAAGLAYGAGIWVDKVIMWHFAPGGLVVAGALRTMPSYDTAMFWSQLASIPVIALFFVHVETRFSALVRTFHDRMNHQASRRELNELGRDIGFHVVSSLFRLFVALAAAAAFMILLSFVLMPQLGLLPEYMSTLRVSLCWMAFYTSIMFCFSFLLHLDLRRQALHIMVIYVALNAILTMTLLRLGPDFYGCGTMIAATFSLLVGFGVIWRELGWLSYHAFVTNNPSV